MAELSPAAKAVLDAADIQDLRDAWPIAAALRAVADQVAPKWECPGWDDDLLMGNWQETERVHRELSAIATELENIIGWCL